MKKVLNIFRGYSRVTIAIVAIVSLIVFNLGFVLSSQEADAAQLSKVKDIITDSDTAVVSNHTVEFMTGSAITGAETITIDFPDSFKSTTSPAFANTDPLDYDIASTSATQVVGEIEVYAAGSCPGSGPTAFEITTISVANVFTFTHCASTDDLQAGATTTIEIGTHAAQGGAGTSRLENPDDTGSYVITIGSKSGADTGDTRVYIIDDVVLTAAVETTFTFAITGIADTETECTEALDITSTATGINFGTLVGDTPIVAAQDLEVTTNAANGFVVTIQQDAPLDSDSGADIDVFDDGTAQTTPATWSVPGDSLADEDTWGHWGFTTEDTDLNGGEFTGGGQKYAGFDGTNPDEIFSHNGPADSVTPDIGKTQVCYKVEVTPLQEAANDYSNTITYIATPTF